MSAQQSWQDRAAAKRQAIEELIPKAWRMRDQVPPAAELKDVTSVPPRYLTERERQITESDAEQIVSQTSKGVWTAEEVTRAFCHRAAIAHQLVDCLHEIFFDAAIDDAKQLDIYFKQHQAPVGPLHGLPVSLKDQLHVKGVETTMGYVGWIGTFQGRAGTGKEKVFESELVRELRKMGAVLYCKTSVPATLMIGETVNNIIGYTKNPQNRQLSSGGSSGGEGALIALRGSVLGFGTDIGGSIRIPSSFCGLYGLRASFGRVPYEGLANSLDGQTTILSVIGPMSSTLGGLRLALKSLLLQQPWLHDPMALELPWRAEEDAHARKNQRSLVFGVLRNDGVVTPHPPISRAIETVVQVLRAAGNQIIDWNPPAHKEGSIILGKAFQYDRGADIRKDISLSGEPLLFGLDEEYGTAKDPETATGIFDNNVAYREYRKKYLDYWNSTADVTGTGRPVDAFIMPVAPHASVLPGKYEYYGYTHIVNVLDYASVALPVTVANKEIDLPNPNHTPVSKADRYELYDAAAYDGAPAGIQIVGRRLQEERVLVMAEYLAGLLKKQSTGSSKSHL